jgi:hypothetical protein
VKETQSEVREHLPTTHTASNMTTHESRRSGWASEVNDSAMHLDCTTPLDPAPVPPGNPVPSTYLSTPFAPSLQTRCPAAPLQSSSYSPHHHPRNLFTQCPSPPLPHQKVTWHLAHVPTQWACPAIATPLSPCPSMASPLTLTPVMWLTPSVSHSQVPYSLILTPVTHAQLTPCTLILSALTLTSSYLHLQFDSFRCYYLCSPHFSVTIFICWIVIFIFTSFHLVS